MEWSLVDFDTLGWLLGPGASENLICVLVTFLIVTVVSKWWLPFWKMPPGPMGLPVVGYLPWIDPKAPYLTFSKMVDRYGKVFSLKMGGVWVIVMADPKVVKDTFNLKSTTERAPLFLTHGVFEGYGLICSDGSLWRDHRKFILGFMRDQGMRAAVSRANMEHRIHLVAKQLTDELAENEEPVEISENLLHHVGNTMTELIFGRKYPEDDPIWRWQRYMLDEGSKLIGVAGPLNFLPWLRFLPMYQRLIRFLWDNHHKTHFLYQLLIEAKEKLLLSHGGMDHNNQDEETQQEFQKEDAEKRLRSPDVVDLPEQTNQGDDFDWKSYQGRDIGKHFMKTLETSINIEDLKEELEKQDRVQKDAVVDKDFIPHNVVEAYLKERSERGDDVGTFTYKQLRHVSGDLFGAGTETTITTLRWHLLNMALFPEVQKRVQKELDEFAGGADHVPLDHSSRLPYTQASIMETQRLRSMVPLGVPHGSSEDLTIEGYHVPAGAMLLPLLWFIHRDPENWNNPEEYIPERFLDQEGNVIRNHPAFMPFQTGRRVCIGDEFAKMILFVFTSRILLKFRVSLENKDPEDDPAKDPVCGLTLTPRPCNLIFTRRM
ncbi:cytochrome P450 306a1-like [Macrobrachium nipponense]|uniref:cytochrome P450 306a1-like n=1 Tax=Macrobrachium nipponense TaxID=159736 RepID=UPI0027A6B501|nr:cytochrome P450 306a1 [Macrobrachium nipponense]